MQPRRPEASVSEKGNGVKRTRILIVEAATRRRCFNLEAETVCWRGGLQVTRRWTGPLAEPLATVALEEEILEGGIPMFTASFCTCSSAASS